MTYAAFRTSPKEYRSRPPARCRAARVAWDVLSQDGPIKRMGLIDGQWMCQRPGGSWDEVEAQGVLHRLREGRSGP